MSASFAPQEESRRIALVEFDPMRIAGCESGLAASLGKQVVCLSFADLLRATSVCAALLQWRPPLSDHATLALLRSAHPQVKLIALGEFLEDGSILSVLKKGVHGCVDDGASPEGLCLAVECVLRDKLWASERVLNRLACTGSEPDRKSVHITQREGKFLNTSSPQNPIAKSLTPLILRNVQ